MTKSFSDSNDDREKIHCHDKECRQTLRSSQFKRQCGLCEHFFCLSHLISKKYYSHLQSVVDRTFGKKYLCRKCFSRVNEIEVGWQKFFLNKECSHDQCEKKLSRMGLNFRSCKMCGLWYCRRHSIFGKLISRKWSYGSSKYPYAMSLCHTCLLSVESAEPLYDIKKIWNKFHQTPDEKGKKFSNFVRSASICTALLILYFVAPMTYRILDNEQILPSQKIWHISISALSAAYLAKEIFVESLKRPNFRIFAVFFWTASVSYLLVRVFS